MCFFKIGLQELELDNFVAGENEISHDEAFDACYDLTVESGYSGVFNLRWNSGFLIFVILSLAGSAYFSFSGVLGLSMISLAVVLLLSAFYPTYYPFITTTISGFQDESQTDSKRIRTKTFNQKNYYDN